MHSRSDALRQPADIEREVLVLKREEQKLTREIKQAAAKGNTAGAKQLAKSLIRLRGQEAKLQASMGQLRGVKTSITVQCIQTGIHLTLVAMLVHTCALDAKGAADACHHLTIVSNTVHAQPH